MDGTQSFAAPPRLPAVPSPSAPVTNPAAAKAPSDYVRALRRRVWLVLAVGVPLSVLAAVWAVRQPPVYRASAQIFIEPPQYDPVLSTLVHHDLGRRDAEATALYLPNMVARLKTKPLAQQVVNDPAFLQGDAPPGPDAADELIANLQTKTHINTNFVTVTLDGSDPARTARQLSTWLDIFAKQAKDEVTGKNEYAKTYASQSLDALKRELAETDRKILDKLRKTSSIGPGGKNIHQAQYESLGAMMMHKRMRLEEAQQQAWIAQVAPKVHFGPEETARSNLIAQLQEKRRALTLQLEQHRRLVRNFDSDPAVKHTAAKLRAVLDHIDQLQQIPLEAATDPADMIVSSMREELHAIEEATAEVLGKLRASMPEHEEFLALKEERELKVKRIMEMESGLSSFAMLSMSQKPPVTVLSAVEEPTGPIRPRRGLNIAFGIVVSFGIGIALVCLLEHLDHSVKVPEHLTVGLTLPLLGVVPRIRRTSLTHRGGHLWTPGVPGSVEADAYRNLRASLLGASDRLGPIVTLLVTSAKAGEGKSTTALNLAATCARAGERTLLMDVDLRRPSLAEVFDDVREAGADGDDAPDLGLVDVLRGELPWQRTVVRTDIANLDFLPTGDARDVPIEILGTLELRQLLRGLAGHYDRVILDGPAVLGLADCRMLGRVVDAAVLVVRSGAHEMRPLQRAKAMLEQSHVRIAGVVFNGLYEDLENWSSYGPYDTYEGLGLDARSAPTRRGLGGPAGEYDALPLAGAVEG
jgi:capsular exopolysaccharide synthesis family protein